MKKKLLITIGIIILVFLTVFAYAHFLGTKGLVVKEIKITDNTIPNSFHGFKVVHLSDIHYGRSVKEKQIKLIVDKINILKPDIVVITGDLLDRDKELTSEQQKILTEQLKKIEVTIGKYIIAGNHDYDNGIDKWQTLVQNSDFINLNDNYQLIYNNGITPILINGMSSNLHNHMTIEKKLENHFNFLKEFEKPNNETIKPAYNIMIIHEPDYVDEFKYDNFNLILAGHSHNGQVRLPFINKLVTPIGAQKYHREQYNLENTKMYISSGLGTSTLDVRLFNKPSINFYRLTTK
ncbi:MAG: metallophosphoesterase [Bacilli bacterium]|nr:metallophosphoesterase [Bacilli bacterium]MDD4547436.1 metallophosphoesterase [Bacilli bacterium]